MSPPSQLCAVCGKFTIEFNYGVPSCNACKIFFRRLIARTKKVRKCYRGENCYDRKSSFNCTICRFQKCLSVGMTLPSYLSIQFNDKSNEQCLQLLLNKLYILNNQRLEYLKNYRIKDCDIALDQLMNVSKVEYIKKPDDFPMNFNSWCFYSGVLTIEFMKQMAFVNLLSFADQQIILKECYIRLGAMFSVKRAIDAGKEEMSFADGTDMLPEREWNNWELENRIRCRLVGRCNELKITNEEFLLFCVLIFCNPAIDNLSEQGKILLTSYQHLYSSALLQYCLIKYPKNGPARFTELLGLADVISKHYQDVINFYVLLQLNKSRVQIKKIIKDGIGKAYQ